jgi:acetolactate synthase-1/2/3 large subunit
MTHISSAAQNSKKHVLVVDDDELQLRALQRLARRIPNITLTVALNADEALSVIAALRPDVIIADVYMPRVDGIAFCSRLKENPDTHHVEVILTSASMTPDLAAMAYSAGATHAVAKPVDLSLLLREESAREITCEMPTAAPGSPRGKRGADVLVAMLAEAGVDVMFGLPGGAISPVHDALLDSPIRNVTTRHESGAMFAAAGYAQTSGKLGVVAVTSGPGCLNAMTGLASAWCDGLPVLLLVGEVPRHAHGKGVLQDGSAHGLQLVEMARHVTKLAAEVPRPSALPHLVRRAIATATSGRKGPVMLTLPLDVTTAPVATPRAGGAITMGEAIAPETVEEIAELLRNAARPLILAGSGVRGGGAPTRLVSVAEQLQCPIATTPKAKGVFPENHPLSLGVLGMGGHASARQYLDDCVDVVLAIGTSLGDLATDGFAPALQGSKALIHIDIDAKQIGKSYEPTHAVVASASALLGALAEYLNQREHGALRPAIRGVHRQQLPSSLAPGLIAPNDAVIELQRALPSDTIYTVDSGDHFLFATHFLEINHPDSFLVMTGLGSMGQSIGAAIGAQLAHPARTVAAICGDGCFAMNAFEIATAVAERLPLRVFVFNDGRLGMVEKGHETVYGRRPDYPTTPLDVCSVARGLGAATLQINGKHQLAAARSALMAAGPVVFDVRIDHQIGLASRDRVKAMAPASTTIAEATSPVAAPPDTPRPLRLVN